MLYLSAALCMVVESRRFNFLQDDKNAVLRLVEGDQIIIECHDLVPVYQLEHNIGPCFPLTGTLYMVVNVCLRDLTYVHCQMPFTARRWSATPKTVEVMKDKNNVRKMYHACINITGNLC